MERQFNRNSYHSRWSNNVLPVVFYLTLPTVNLNQNSRKNTGRKTKSQKQKQRDQERMKQFNEQKTVCSQFPFALVDNDEIQDQDQDSLPVIRELVPSSHQRSELSNTILCIFSG